MSSSKMEIQKKDQEKIFQLEANISAFANDFKSSHVKEIKEGKTIWPLYQHVKHERLQENRGDDYFIIFFLMRKLREKETLNLQNLIEIVQIYLYEENLHYQKLYAFLTQQETLEILKKRLSEAAFRPASSTLEGTDLLTSIAELIAVFLKYNKLQFQA